MPTELSFSPNRLYYGDCLDVLRGWPAECVDLVYLDPPFNSKANYNILYGGGNGVPAQVRAFTDTWHWDEAATARMNAAERAPARRSHRVLTGLRTVLGETGMLAYPTQKPVALLNRIIEASSNPGDVVLDPFCGCGTTVAAAELAKRQWVGIDISPFAVKLVRDRRLRPMGRDAEIAGIPTDMDGAQMLLDRSPLDFEAWAVTAVPGLAPNERRVGDRGIDGRGSMMHQPAGESSRLVVAQVKGGGYTATTMRDFQRVIEREKAAAGIYITLRKVNARGARQAAAELGIIEIGARQYPKLQLWSVEELLDGKWPTLPDMADPYTGKRVRQAELFE